MRVLFLNPTQFVAWEQEPSNYVLRLPLLKSGVVSEYRDFAYRDRTLAVGRAAMLGELRALAASFAPDVVVYGNTLREWRLTPDELASLRVPGRRIVGTLYDAHDRPLDDEFEFFQRLDALVIADSLFTYARYRLLADHHYPGKTILYLDGHQVTPDLFNPGDGTKRYDVSHIGTVYGGRAAFLDALARGLAPRGRAVSQFGGLFDRTEVERRDNLVLYDYARAGGFLPWDEYARTLRQSRCCLTLQTDPGYVRVRGKTFEILASCALCVVQDAKEYHLLLPEDAFVPVISPEDAAAKLAALLDAPAELERRARIGWEWFRDTFDCRAFWIEAMAAIEAGASPALRSANARAAYESLRADLFAHYQGPPSEQSLLKMVFS